MKTNHAPGPWATDISEALDLNDAHLISTAPEMLAQLEQLYDIYGHEWSPKRADAVLTVIAKAKGESR